jgi:hypothetical protein
MRNHNAKDKGGRPLRRVLGVSVVSLAVLAAAAVVVSNRATVRHEQARSAQVAAKPAPAAVTPKPLIPPEAMLNGSYRLTLEDSQSKYLHSSASDWSSASVDYVGYIQFSTQCTGSECVATSTPTSDPNSPALGKTVETMIWVSGKWASREDPMPEGDGLDESSTVLRSDGHRGFLGTTTDTIISGSHAGAEISAPVVLTPRFDPANL